MLCYLESGHYIPPTLKAWGLIFPVLKGGPSYVNYLELFSTRDLFLLSYLSVCLSIHPPTDLLNHLFDIFDLISIVFEYIHIPERTHGYLFYSLSYNSIQLYIFIQIFPTLVIELFLIGSPDFFHFFFFF